MQRLRNSGGATGGAQFSASVGSSLGVGSGMSHPGFYNDYRQVRRVTHCFVIFTS